MINRIAKCIYKSLVCHNIQHEETQKWLNVTKVLTPQNEHQKSQESQEGINISDSPLKDECLAILLKGLTFAPTHKSALNFGVYSAPQFCLLNNNILMF